MERSLAFDLHIMLCLPASPHLCIYSDKIRALTEGSECDTVLLLGGKGKYHICIARFLKLEHAETRRGEDALLLGDIATPWRCRLGSGALTAAKVPRDKKKMKYEESYNKASLANPVVWRENTCVWFGSCSSLIAYGHKCHECLK